MPSTGRRLKDPCLPSKEAGLNKTALPSACLKGVHKKKKKNEMAFPVLPFTKPCHKKMAPHFLPVKKACHKKMAFPFSPVKLLLFFVGSRLKNLSGLPIGSGRRYNESEGL